MSTLNKKNKLLCTLQFGSYENHALLDTSAILSAQSKAELRKITTPHPEGVLQELPLPNFKIQVANENIVSVRKQIFTTILQ